MFINISKILVAASLASVNLIILTPSVIARTVPSGFANKPGCYKIGDERVKFVARVVTTTSDLDLNDILSSLPKRCDSTHVWDDQWYYYTLPDNRPKYLLLMWKNINNGEGGWVFVQNTPTRWWYKKNGSSGYQTIRNGESSKVTWWSNGSKIDIDLNNPKNSGGWTANDIWYSFGF